MYERIHVAVDSVMPDFTLKDEFGKNLSLKKFKRDKKYVVLAIIRGVDDAHTRQQLDYLQERLPAVPVLRRGRARGLLRQRRLQPEPDH